jgi:hypothetical protein
MEQLETRNLLCEGVPPLFDPPPDSYRSDNVSDDLARVAYEFDRWASGPNGVQRDFSPTFCEAVVRDGRVLVEAIAADAASGPALVSELRAIDVEIIASYEHGVSAWVPLTRIDDLSGLSELLYANIAFAHGMVHEPVGQVLHPVAQIVDGAAQIAPVGAVDFRGTRNVPAVRVDDYSDVPVFYRSSRVSDQLARTAFEFAQRPPGLDIHDYVPTDDWVSVREGLVLINAVSTSVPGQKLGEALATLGANVLGSYAHGVAAWLPVGRIPELGKLADLTFASPSLAFGMTHAGNAMTQGDAVIRTDQLRTTFGFDGTGQTIGVISDSYNRLTGAANDIANGDLPNTGATLANPTPAITDNFGRSVATSGNNVVVGAHLDDTGATNSGQAYVFNATTGALVATLANPTPAASDYFGYSVSVSGNNVVVGAYLDDTGATNSGQAYVFNATTGALVATLANPTPAASDYFGFSVAVSGNNVVVGAYLDDTGATNSGQAYVFNATTGAFVGTLANPSPAASDYFGYSVSVSGNNIVVGAYLDDAVATNSGQAYVFNATTGALVATLANPTPAANDYFGISVAVSGSNVVVGANQDDTGATNSGQAYVFNATDGALIVTLANPTPAADDVFGESVSVSGSNVVVGASADDTGATNSGQAYVFNVIVVAELPTNSVYFPNGTDEGRAMLQIAYDVAPNANLAFATAHGGKFGLAAAINALRDAGATVIVDDVLYPDEPMFMDGVVAQAADAAVAAGVSYVSAVGNSARRSYETTAFANSAVLGNYGRGNVPLHDFDPGPAVDVYQQITIPANAAFSVVLQWQDPFMTDAPASGGATHDLDLLLLNAAGNTILQSSTLNNPSTTRDPFEILTYVNGPTQLTANLVVAGVNVAGLGRFKYVVTNSNVTIDQFPTNSGTSYGHSNAAGVIAVGAEDALTAPLQLEPFSSAGGVPILFNSVGQPIAAQTRQTPDIVGPDNVNTTFFGIDSPNDTDTLPNFAGTSAAAPHVAGLLALLRQANPTATPAELLTALTSTATDMGIAGYDNDTGFGAVNGLEAEYNLFKPALAPDLSAASDNGQSSTDNVTSLTTLTFTGTVPAASFVGLFDNGGSVPVASQQLAAAATAYSINVTVPSNTAHSYSIRVKSSSTSTNYSKFSPALPVYVDALATYTPPVPDLTAASDTGYSNTDNITTNTTPTFAGTLAANGTSALVTLWVDGVQRGSQQLAAGATSYTITSSTLSAGSHSALIRAKKVTSAPTTSYFSSPSLPFTIDTSPPVGTITPVSPPGNAPPQSSFTITFNKGVVGVDLSDFTLTRNGGANRLPGSATLTASADSKTFTISHFADITMAAGSYVLTLNYANSGIQSFAGVAPTGTNPSTSWSQGSGTTGFQNAARYYDVDNDTYVSPLDSLIIINATDTGYSGPLPGGAFTTAPPFLDANGDSNLSPIDALVVINFIDAYSGGGGGPYLLAAINSPPPEVSLQDVTASVELEIVDSTGAVVTSVQVGDQFELRARLIVNGPPGVAPFAAYTDVRFTPGLIVPAGVVGNASSLQGQAEIDDAGGIMYDFRSGESSSVIFGQSFIATKSGTVTFSADAADLFGHDILVTGLNQPLPLSQVAFGTTRLKITAKRK